jgi:hypothetical protein
MSDQLRDYLARACRRRFAWGEFDCCLFMADWILERRGVDPAGALRGAYSGPRQALRIIRAAGGLRSLAAALAHSAGLPARTGVVCPDDVAVVQVGRRQAGAIRTGKGWAVLTPGGYLVAPLPALAVWEV